MIGKINSIGNRNPKLNGIYKGLTWEIYDSPLYGENGYILIPNSKEFSELNDNANDYDAVNDAISPYINHDGMTGDGSGHPTELTYGDDLGWIGFDVNHLGDVWRNSNGEIESFESMMTAYQLGWDSDFTEDLTLASFNRVWTRDDVIATCKAIINGLIAWSEAQDKQLRFYKDRQHFIFNVNVLT